MKARRLFPALLEWPQSRPLLEVILAREKRCRLAGAVSLSLSGYLGITFASRSGGALAEYAGIWYLGAASGAVGALAGWVAHRRMQGELRGVPLLISDKR